MLSKALGIRSKLRKDENNISEKIITRWQRLNWRNKKIKLKFSGLYYKKYIIFWTFSSILLLWAASSDNKIGLGEQVSTYYSR